MAWSKASSFQPASYTAAASAAVPAFAADAGLKAVWANHYTYVAPDLKKTRDWYHEVYGMQIGQEEAKLSHMWFGDKGGDTLMIIRQANPGEEAPRVERFAFTLANFDKKTVEAELARRGLQPGGVSRSLHSRRLSRTNAGQP